MVKHDGEPGWLRSHPSDFVLKRMRTVPCPVPPPSPGDEKLPISQIFPPQVQKGTQALFFLLEIFSSLMCQHEIQQWFLALAFVATSLSMMHF